MRRQILQDQQPHRLLLPGEEGVGEGHLQEALEVQGQQGQAEEHAQQDQEEDAQDEREVEGQHGERQEVVDAKAVGYGEKPENDV